ncbi:MAG: hypothetical protein IJV69_03245 [Kiritimatiellae bacterium]|nr:hypothetical protein [Kiritimatiellia bacterium]
MKRYAKLFLFSPMLALLLLAVLIGTAYAFRWFLGPYDADENIVIEIGTYCAYLLSFVALAYFSKDHLHTSRRRSFLAIAFLWCVALVREMGAQHWLTAHDTTAVKIRFFTNPANPLSEKIIVGGILLVLIIIAVSLLVKHIRQMVVGFFKGDAFYWTLATFGGFGILSQIVDRFPSRYSKRYGELLPEPTLFGCKVFEECSEMLLPILFIVALWQLHLQLVDASSETGV